MGHIIDAKPQFARRRTDDAARLLRQTADNWDAGRALPTDPCDIVNAITELIKAYRAGE